MSYNWFALPNGRSVYRKAEQPRGERSGLPCPMLVRDFDEPVQSMADGKYYANKAALRRTYRADGNPQGIEYQEVGTSDTRAGPEAKKITHEEVATLLDKAEAKIARGEVPEARSFDNT